PSAYPRVALWGQTVQLHDGRLLHTMQVGEARMSPGCRCMATWSDDLGKSWSAPRGLVVENLPGDWRPTFTLPRLGSGRNEVVASAIRNKLVLPETDGWQ